MMMMWLITNTIATSIIFTQEEPNISGNIGSTLKIAMIS